MLLSHNSAARWHISLLDRRSAGCHSPAELQLGKRAHAGRPEWSLSVSIKLDVTLKLPLDEIGSQCRSFLIMREMGQNLKTFTTSRAAATHEAVTDGRLVGIAISMQAGCHCNINSLAASIESIQYTSFN